MVRRRLTERHARKPDQNEPYRYVCPECRHEVRENGRMKGSVYKCYHCNQVYQKSELWDKKEEKVVGHLFDDD